MSMPSDTNPDIADAVEKIEAQRQTSSPEIERHGSEPKGNWTRDQNGIVVAALVAFLGVAFIGPAVARALQKQKMLEQRIALRAEYARRRAKAVGRRLKKKARRLGGRVVQR